MHVELTALGHRFGDGPWLFQGITTRLVPGEVYSLSGPSGSGKSTLLGIIAGWITPSTGTATQVGVSHTGWVFQSPHGIPRRTTLDHTVLPLLAQSHSRETAEPVARQLLTTFGLGHRADHPFRDLSGGEAQRLMLARAVAANNDLLLVDEPTAQLDRATSATVSNAITALAGDGRIVVVATHDADTRAACSQHLDLTHHTSAAAATTISDQMATRTGKPA